MTCGDILTNGHFTLFDLLRLFSIWYECDKSPVTNGQIRYQDVKLPLVHV